MNRNLIAHIYACPGVRSWTRAVAHIKARLPLWNGRKLVSIAYDEAGTRQQACDMFIGTGIDIIAVPNDPAIGEMVSFEKLLRGMQGEPGVTFYCHGKGIRHPSDSPVHNWADVMFHLCCDYPELFQAALMDYPVAGSFMRREYRMEVDWHFSGTFFWFRNEDVFNQPHMKFSDPLNRCDVERWPARMFKFEEAHCLGMPDCRNLYDEINWRSWITRRFQKEVLWDATMRRERTKAITDWSALPETAFEPLGEIYKCMKAA